MGRARRSLMLLGLLAAASGLVACSSGDDAGDDAAAAATTTTTTPLTTATPPTSTTTTAAAEVDDVYAVPDPLPSGEPGEVIQVEPLGSIAGIDDATGWRVLYHSRSLEDEDIAVSGVIVRPAGPAPPGGFPVLSWAHGTTGTADLCAPSKLTSPFVPSLAELLAAGYVVAATDYEGLGTPGLHPYLVGQSEGRGVLDAARAAAQLPGVDAGSSVVVWGHSQGGHAALFAGEIAADYAPDLDVLGVIAMAPAGNMEIIGAATLTNVEVFPFGFMALGTWPEAYPDLDLTQLFAPAALDRLPLLDAVCSEEVFQSFDGLTLGDVLVTTAPLEVPPVQELLTENTVGARPYGDIPVLVVHGRDDQLIPVGLSESLVAELCTGDAHAELRTYAADHGSIPAVSGPDVLAWTAARFAGDPVTAGC